VSGAGGIARRGALKTLVAAGALALNRPAAAQAPASALSSTRAQVSFVVYLPTRPEARQRMRTMMFAVLDAMSREPDFVRTWSHVDMNDPDLIINYETWACTREYFIAHHLKKPYRQAYELALPDMLSGERKIVFMQQIGAYPGRST